MRIAVIGFGYIGSVISAVMCQKGFEVVAIEKNDHVVEDLNNGISNIPEPGLCELIRDSVSKGLLSGVSDYKIINTCDAILVTVGTPLSDNYDADLTALKDVFRELSSNCIDGQIVMIKSTVPPGVTRQLYQEYLGNKDISVAFSPERLAEGNAISQLKELPIVVGGVNETSTRECSEFWKLTLGSEVIEVSSSEAAELVKLADNQWIDLNIALSNELAILCDSLPHEIDVLEVIKGANTLKKGTHYVNILTPSIGVGGYCLTKDPWFLDALAKKIDSPIKLPSVGRYANDLMPHYAANQVSQFIEKTESGSLESQISVMGYSFKSNSGDIRFTPMKVFVDDLLNKGYRNIYIYDPTIIDGKYDHEYITWVDSYEICLEHSLVTVFGAAHDEIKAIPLRKIAEKMVKGGLVYDGRIYLVKEEIEQLRKFGLSYKGIGR